MIHEQGYNIKEVDTMYCLNGIDGLAGKIYTSFYSLQHYFIMCISQVILLKIYFSARMFHKSEDKSAKNVSIIIVILIWSKTDH